jgi:hypothetical protein
MAQESGFFNAKVVEGEFDRVYLAETFARYFASFIGNGVFAGISSALQVTQTNTASFEVLAQLGQAWINGYWFALDGEPHTLSITLPDGVLPRIDSVVVRYSTVGRTITLEIKTGTPAITPVAPPVQRDADAYELQLATIAVRAGATSIRQQDITDTRPDSTVCGWVHGVVDQIDTATLGLQLQNFIDEYKAQFNADYEAFLLWLEDLKALALQEYNDFLAYLASLRTSADTELAAFIAYLLSLRSNAQLRHDEFVAFLQELRVESTDRVQELIDELEALIAGQPIGDLLLRVIALEDLRAIAEIAVITHGLDEYCKVDLYEYADGAGIGGAGVAGAGGTVLTSSPASYDLHEKDTITVRAKESFGTVADVLQLRPSKYIINFAQDGKSILAILTPHSDSLPDDMMQRIITLEQALFNNFTTNDTQVLFDTLDGLRTTGIWNENDRRLEI